MAAVAVREYGSAAVAIGIHNRRGAYQGWAVEGQFRATHVFTRKGTGDTVRWRFVSQHLSPMAQPPARPPAEPAQPPARPPAEPAQPREHSRQTGGAR